MVVPKSRYAKPFHSIPQQIELLRSRGMSCGSDEDATQILQRHGYYRLSGYSHLYRDFENAEHPYDRMWSQFIPGTSLANVESLHNFDEGLRHLLLRGLAIIEVTMRFHIGHRLGRSHIFAHRDPSQFEPVFSTWKVNSQQQTVRSRHSEWLAEYGKQESRAQETFVDHFRRKYGRHLPIWVATEVMTFGTLTRLFNGMRLQDRRVIAARFQIFDKNGQGDVAVFSSWLNHLRHVRNVCAHHGRIWNRTFDATLAEPDGAQVPALKHIQDDHSRSLYGTISVLRFLLASIAPGNAWSDEIVSYIDQKLPPEPVKLASLGFEESWRSRELWQPGFTVDRLPSVIADCIDQIDSYTRPEALEALYSREKTSERKQWLKYLETKKALIVLQLGGVNFYPKFQFTDGDVNAAVADITERLLLMASSTPHAMESRLKVATWWQTAHPQLPNKISPAEAVYLENATELLENLRLT